MIRLDFSDVQLNLRRDEDKTRVFDPVRKRWLILTPEEHIRQYLLQYLIGKRGYPTPLLSVEKSITVGSRIKRFDVVVYDRSHNPWMLVECKNPDVPVTEQTLYQLLSYQNVIQCRYWLLTNGHETFCADAADIAAIKWLSAIPDYGG